MTRRYLFISLFIFTSIVSLCAPKAFTVKEDLQPAWRIYQDQQYQPYVAQADVNTIYFEIDAEKFSGDYLRIGSATDVAVFVNGKLASTTVRSFNIDSLSRKFGATTLLIAIHQKNISKRYLKTSIDTPLALSSISLLPENKPGSSFRDFVVIASLLLLSMLVIVMRLNPKLASDYFSVSRIFSLRESDDSQIYMRITSSTNILFYVFCSLILGFYLMVVFRFISPEYTWSTYVKTHSFVGAFFQWLLVSVLILAAFFVKIILVYVTSALFGSRDMAGIHFFNWVRLLLIVFGVLSIILYFYFILHGQSSTFHGILLKLIAWCLAGWTIIIFFKLRGRSGYSMFHLFSYICATEIIPLLIIITVLYN